MYVCIKTFSLCMYVCVFECMYVRMYVLCYILWTLLINDLSVWYKQLEDGTSSPCTYVSLLVAHRETIRNMLCERLALPYCCIASFVNKDESSDDSNKKPPEEVYTRNLT